MKNFKNETSCVSSEEPNALSDKTGINFMIFILIFLENCLHYGAKHDFSVWLRTGSNPADINWFQSHTGKYFSINFMYSLPLLKCCLTK